jgi:hypothetical protein
MCLRHDVPAVGRDIAELRNFTRGIPDLGADWFCPVSGCALNDFGPDQR